MEKILAKFIQDEINRTKRVVEELEIAANRRSSKLQSVLREIDNLPETTCPICQAKNKDVTHIIERNFGVYWEGSYCGMDLKTALSELERSMSLPGHWDLFITCERCATTSPVNNTDFLKENNQRVWDRDLNLPGKSSKAYRILDEHPQVEELIYNPRGYWYVKIEDQWYRSMLKHMIW